MTNRTGIWFVGARGAVATTAQVGLAALAAGQIATTGLVTELPLFAGVPLADWGQLVVGGHEVREGCLVDAARSLERQRVLPAGATDAVLPALEENDTRIRPGIAEIVSPRDEIDRLKGDLEAFRQANKLGRVVVVLLASTEPDVDPTRLPSRWLELDGQLLDGQRLAAASPLPISSLYAIAAIESGMPVVNFTPSLGASCDAIEELARSQNVCHAGRDGKTGETLLKTVLAPMFAARNLEVMSWVGHNLLGNEDGRTLNDPASKAAKIRSKAESLDAMLADSSPGSGPQSHVSIEYIRSLGDWKTAWDHVHFRGFFGAPMTLQFTWQGCDSALAAPLVLDLVRLVDLAASRGETGALTHLASFFKSPAGVASHAFYEQYRELVAYIENVRSSASAVPTRDT